MAVNTEGALKKTALHPIHLELGARMGPFGGYDMPIQYEGIIKEHMACREKAALFDTCHMGEFLASGPQSESVIEKLVSCDVSTIAIGQCRYGLLCNEKGGVIDDLIVYRMEQQKFLIVVNAGTQDNDFAWFSQHAVPGVKFENISAGTHKIDLQGPASPAIMEKLAGKSIRDLRYYHFAMNTYRDQKVLVSRTGYTGEIGFEIYLHDEQLTRDFWKQAMSLGAVSAGLGCRDTLRLEMGMPLYGHEMDESRNAAESGFTRAISTTKDFNGSSAVRAGGSSKLSPIYIEGRSAARNGDRIKDEAGNDAGVVTSGSFSPSLGHAIALGYVRKDAAGKGSKVRIQTARQELAGIIGEAPFYRNATARKPLADFLGT